MKHSDQFLPAYGMGLKKLSVYSIGIALCLLLTLTSFWAVMLSGLPRTLILAVIYLSAIIQFLVQLFCFLRLNTLSEQGKMNVMSLIFTAVVLTSIIVGSLWIMSNLNYNMMN